MRVKLACRDHEKYIHFAVRFKRNADFREKYWLVPALS